MSETFSSEGSGVIAFQTDREIIDGWLSSKPLWRDNWERGRPPNWVTELGNVPMPKTVVSTWQGDMGNGQALVIDKEDGTVWLLDWNW